MKQSWIIVTLLAACQFESSSSQVGAGSGDPMNSTGGSPVTSASEVTTVGETSGGTGDGSGGDSGEPSGMTTSSTDPTGESESTGRTTSSGPDSGAESTAGEGSSSTSGEPVALEVAEELVLSLDAADATPTGWPNAGALGELEAVGAPTVEVVGGLEAVTLSVGNAYRSTQDAPATLVEPDSTRTIEVWVHNAGVGLEETLVSWGRRNGPTGALMAFLYGTHADWGAANQWGDADLPWSEVPLPQLWHHLVYTFDGTTTRVYVDGVLDNEEVLGPGVIDTHDHERIVVGAQTESNGDLGRFGTLSIARVRVHAGALGAAQVENNYELERVELGL